jgi:predicted nucleic acid-binding protein
MNGSDFLLDTNIVLYLLNGDKTLAQLLGTNTMYISFVTEMELLSFPGLTLEEEQQIKLFIASCHCIDFNQSVKVQAVYFRKTYRLKLPDAIIAATAYCTGLTLISADLVIRKVNEITLLGYDPQG